MKPSIFLIVVLFSSFIGTAQILDNNLDSGVILPSDDQPIKQSTYSLNKKGHETPSVDLKNPLEDPVSFSIETTTDLLDAGEELEKRWKDNKYEKSAEYDQYLGDFKTKSSYFGFQCRDFGSVDGDYVQIIVNDVVVKRSMFLNGYFVGVNIDLEPGLNRIDIIALGVGSASPNTGHFVIVDEDGSVIKSHMWNLLAGGTGTLVIIKE
ncbi:MAG: hypothetical protein ACPGU9_06755 [Flavobacteriaceae bacterium]